MISKKSYWFKAGFYSLLQNISNLVLNFLGFYFLVRLFDKDEFGIWTLFLTATSIVEVARIGFLKNGFIKFKATVSRTEQDDLFTASLLLNFCFALLCSTLFLLFSNLLSDLLNSPGLEFMFNIYAITSIFLVPFFQFEFSKHANLDFKSVFIAYLIRNSVMFLFIIISYLEILNLTIKDLALVHLLAAIVSSVAVIYYFERFKVSPIKWKLVLLLFKYGRYSMGTSISSMLYNAADQFILGSLVSTVSVALYGVSNRILNLINVPSITLSSIVFPKSSQVFVEKGEIGVSRIYEKSVGTLLAINIPLIAFVLLFPDMVITIIAGDTYKDVVPILRISILTCLFMPFSHQFGNIFDSIGKPNVNFYTTVSTILFGIILNYFLILKFGIMGAVFGTLITMSASFVFMQLLLKNEVGVRMSNIIKEIIITYKLLFRIS